MQLKNGKSALSCLIPLIDSQELVGSAWVMTMLHG